MKDQKRKCTNCYFQICCGLCNVHLAIFLDGNRFFDNLKIYHAGLRSGYMMLCTLIKHVGNGHGYVWNNLDCDVPGSPCLSKKANQECWHPTIYFVARVYLPMHYFHVFFSYFIFLVTIILYHFHGNGILLDLIRIASLSASVHQ